MARHETGIVDAGETTSWSPSKDRGLFRGFRENGDEPGPLKFRSPKLGAPVNTFSPVRIPIDFASLPRPVLEFHFAILRDRHVRIKPGHGNGISGIRRFGRFG